MIAALTGTRALTPKRLLAVWEAVRTSYWVVPALMACAAIALAFAMVELDQLLQREGERVPTGNWMYASGPEGARSVLSTIAGSMITVAGVVFSVTIVALTLASAQFGSRLLRTFIRDPGNQVVLGTFIATFVYCLLVLRTIGGTGDGAFVPHVAVAGGVVLALASLGVLIFFIHHLARAIQAENVIAAVADELDEVIEHLFPEEIGHDPPAGDVDRAAGLPADFARRARPVRAGRDGYVLVVDDDALMAVARDHDLLVRIERRPGQFVIAGTTLALVAPGERVDDELADAIGATFVLGAQRSPPQDAEYGFTQLVELALRGLSPGINDPLLAITCIDRIGQALARLARRSMPSGCRHDDAGALRVVAQPERFEALVAGALDPIRLYGKQHPSVTIRLLETIAAIADHAANGRRRAVLRDQAEAILQESRSAALQERDQEAIRARYEATLAALAVPAGSAEAERPAA